MLVLMRPTVLGSETTNATATNGGVFRNRNMIVAALGPTNTGKTYRAIERMLEHRTGMLGFPLRLLAREVYNSVVARVGADRVALVTGEERLVPASPDYWVCTVEAMPVETAVEFVGVDEIQLAASSHRGYIFTDRLLHARGTKETWFMGSDSARSVVEQLVPGVGVRMFPRLSELRYVGSMRLDQLPPRSAVVAFSAHAVYEHAERLRGLHGGAAVVLGAMSPRSRNAQVELYQSGEVDYIVATDAIGMGLNLDIDMVALAATRKFDGRETRDLEPSEIAQIAGRAGRAKRGGSFCTLPRAPMLAPELVASLEGHRLDPIERVLWRANASELDFTSIDSLVESLAAPPPGPPLVATRESEDLEALVQLSYHPDVRRLAKAGSVELLWAVCQVPNFSRAEYGHIMILEQLYQQLAGDGCIDPWWMRQSLDDLDNVSGDLEMLMARLASVRTWTYVSNRAGWVNAAEVWRERTRAVEDRLSDALHERLVARFVDRKRRRARRPQPRPAPVVEGQMELLPSNAAIEPVIDFSRPK